MLVLKAPRRRPQPPAELKDLTHSSESGVLEQGNMENEQGGGPGPGLRWL